MEIKTCEEYVLNVLEDTLKEKEKLEEENLELKNKINNLEYDIKLIKKYCNFEIECNERLKTQYITVNNGNRSIPIILDDEDDFEVFKELIFNDRAI